MIFELFGDSGVGKFSIGLLLAERLDGRLIDNHTIFNPAFAVTDFRSPAFYHLVRAVRDLTFDAAAAMPSGVPILLTVTRGRDLDWGREWQQKIRQLADRRGSVLFGVQIVCDAAERARRFADPARGLMRKATDPAAVADITDSPILLDHSDVRLRMDVTKMGAGDAAERIVSALHDRS